MKTTIIILITILLMGCYENKGDQTCWAHTASDIVVAEGLDRGRNVYDEMVDHFGDGRGSAVRALRWWLTEIGEDPGRAEFRVEGDFEHIAYWVFEDDSKAIGFRVKKHLMTAYKLSDMDGYRINCLVWLSVPQPPPPPIDSIPQGEDGVD